MCRVISSAWPGLGEGGAYVVGVFGVDLDGVDMASARHHPGHAQGRIAGKCAEFDYAARAYHGCKHGQEAPLGMVAAHARIEPFEMRAAVEGAQVRWFGVDMARYIVVNVHRNRVLRYMGLTSTHMARWVSMITAISTQNTSGRSGIDL